MPKICYVKKRFGASALGVISKANEIIASYEEGCARVVNETIIAVFVK